MAKGKRTPVMEQYFRAKDAYPDCVLFFRLGDFYELFYEDAVEVARLLELTLTSRGTDEHGEKIPMAGVPHHASAAYIARLLEQGKRVALCEQMADPAMCKGVVPREVVRVLSPGFCLESEVLSPEVNNFMVVAVPVPLEDANEAKVGWGIACFDVSTSEFRVGCAEDTSAWMSMLAHLEPSELLLPGADAVIEAALLQRSAHCRIDTVTLAGWQDAGCLDDASPMWRLPDARIAQWLAMADAQVPSKEAFLFHEAGASSAKVLKDGGDVGERLFRATCVATAALARQVAAHRPKQELRLGLPRWLDREVGVVLDETAVQNLELVRTFGGDKRGSLVGHVDHTRTAMGARLLRRRVLSPSVDVALIGARHDAVAWFRDASQARASFRASLAKVGDLERLCARMVHDVAQPKDLAALRDGLGACGEAFGGLQAWLGMPSSGELNDGGVPDAGASQCDEHALVGHETLRGMLLDLDVCADVHAVLCEALVDVPALSPSQGQVIADGHSEELRLLRDVSSKARDRLLALEQRERARTGIPTLKVGYTRVFGYYIEISRAKLKSLPEDYRRKQTVANAERFMTDELAHVQDELLHGEERARALEATLVAALKTTCAKAEERLRALAARVADLDVHASFAELAHRHAHVRPVVDTSRTMSFEALRHPVIEALVPDGAFVPNDLALDADHATDDSQPRMMLITGPNMAGKSTYMRQVALAVVLAQAGGFVPARAARFGVVDRVLTRVGASDRLNEGSSTFMVEMRETAAILHRATRNSLVILDEIGRGTSTRDGLAIAGAVTEYLHDVIGCRALFATHYHELSELAGVLDGLQNVSVAVREDGDDVVLLHKVVPGAASKSFGIAVAKMAGLPASVVRRARQRLADVDVDGGERSKGRERDTDLPTSGGGHAGEGVHGLQGVDGLQGEGAQLVRALLGLDIARMTPLEAIQWLATHQDTLRSVETLQPGGHDEAGLLGALDEPGRRLPKRRVDASVLQHGAPQRRASGASDEGLPLWNYAKWKGDGR